MINKEISVNKSEDTLESGDVYTGGGDFVGRIKFAKAEVGGVSIGGDVSGSTIVTGDHNIIGSTITQNEEHIQKVFTRSDERPDTDPLDKEDLKTDVKEIQEEVSKGEKADETFIARRLRNIQHIAPDILEVVLSTIANPVAGFGMVARTIAEI